MKESKLNRLYSILFRKYDLNEEIDITGNDRNEIVIIQLELDQTSKILHTADRVGTAYKYLIENELIHKRV